MNRQADTSRTPTEPVPDRLVDEREAARLLGLSVRSLQGWRVKRSDGPPFVKCGRAVRYRWRDLVDWMDRNTVRSTGGSEV